MRQISWTQTTDTRVNFDLNLKNSVGLNYHEEDTDSEPVNNLYLRFLNF